MTPKAIIELAQHHGASSYRNRADTQHPAYGFTEGQLVAFVQELLAGKCLQQIAEPAAQVFSHMVARPLTGFTGGPMQYVAVDTNGREMPGYRPELAATPRAKAQDVQRHDDAVMHVQALTIALNRVMHPAMIDEFNRAYERLKQDAEIAAGASR